LNMAFLQRVVYQYELIGKMIECRQIVKHRCNQIIEYYKFEVYWK
jgi:hypothetical protein